MDVIEAWERQPPIRGVITKVEDDLLVSHRWLVAVGAIYAGGVFTGRLTDPDGPYCFSATETQWIFSASLTSFAVVMVAAGRLQARVGPRPIAILGGLLLATGYGLAGLFGSTFIVQLIFIGFVGGAGMASPTSSPSPWACAGFPICGD